MESTASSTFGLVFGLGQWKGKVDSDRASFKEFMTGIKDDLAQIRSDINRIVERLPSGPLARGKPASADGVRQGDIGPARRGHSG